MPKLRANKRFKSQRGRAIDMLLGTAARTAGSAARRFLGNKWEQTTRTRQSTKRGSPQTPRSQTVTKRRKKYGISRNAENGSTTTSKNSIAYKPGKGWKGAKTMGAPCTYTVVKPFSCVSSVSKQGVTGYTPINVNNIDMPIALDRAQIKDIYQRIAQNRLNVGGVSSIVTGDMQPTGIDLDSAKRLMIKSCTHVTRLSNQSASNNEVDFYLLMWKNSEQTYLSPADVWDQGITQTQGPSAVGSINNPDFPYQKPTLSKAFNQKWRVVHHQRLYLCPGADHVHTFNFKVNRIIDGDHIDAYEDINGITFIPMVVARGTLGEDTSGTTRFEAGAIGTSNAKIIGVTKTIVRAQMMNFWPKITYTTNQLAVPNTLLAQNQVAPGPVDVLLPANQA